MPIITNRLILQEDSLKGRNIRELEKRRDSITGKLEMHLKRKLSFRSLDHGSKDVMKDWLYNIEGSMNHKMSEWSIEGRLDPS